MYGAEEDSEGEAEDALFPFPAMAGETKAQTEAERRRHFERGRVHRRAIRKIERRGKLVLTDVMKHHNFKGFEGLSAKRRVWG